MIIIMIQTVSMSQIFGIQNRRKENKRNKTKQNKTDQN